MTKMQKNHISHHFEIFRFFTQRRLPRQVRKLLEMKKMKNLDIEGPEGLCAPYVMIKNR